MLGERLKHLREENKLTQRNIAKLLNVSDRTIGYYETNERTPDPDAIIKLSNFFNVSTDFLLGKSKYRHLSLDRVNDITEIINYTINYFEDAENLLLNEKPASSDAVNAIISALKVGLEMANRKVK